MHHWLDISSEGNGRGNSLLCCITLITRWGGTVFAAMSFKFYFLFFQGPRGTEGKLPKANEEEDIP